MTTWTERELDLIGGAEEIRISSRRRDGTLRRPVIIWIVRVDEDLFVRSAHGQSGSWYRFALERLEGQVQAGGIGKDVAFVVEHDPAVNDRIDAAYLTKYGRYPQYVAPMVTPEVREATFRLEAKSN